MEIAFITGATSGIGKSTAYLLAKKGYRLIITGRRKAELAIIKKELSEHTEIMTLCFDVCNRKEVETELSELPENWKPIDILINNAGNAHGFSPIDEGLLDDWDAMIDINVKGLLYVSRAILPQMVERKKGHIINIGSIAGKEVYPNGNVYCASKYAVDAITQGMRIDLNTYNIKVTAINPGMVETEFSSVRFKGDKEKAKSVYKGMTPLRPDDIAEIIYFIVSRPPHVNIADLIVLPTAQASAVIVNRK
jgi:NADP-dependent 3-hydroxy acid dehydrogenase YdfG